MDNTINLERYSELNMFYRPETNDLDIIRSAYSTYSKMLPEDNYTGVAVDVGAHIGIFTLLANIKGMKVWSFEPFRENFEILELNCRDRENCILYEAAITSTENPTMQFPRGKGRAGSSIYLQRKRTQPTPVIGIKPEFIFTLKPRVLKLDCEGSEYDVISAMPSNCQVEILFVEWHFSLSFQPIANSVEWYSKAMSKLRAMGFIGDKPDILPENVGKRFHTQNVYRRN